MIHPNSCQEKQTEGGEAEVEAKGSPTTSRNIDFLLLRAMMKSNIQDYLKRIPFLSKVSTSRLEMLGKMSNFELFRAGKRAIVGHGRFHRHVFTPSFDPNLHQAIRSARRARRARKCT